MVNGQLVLKPLTTVKLVPVGYDHRNPDSENSKFWKASPSGSFELGCVNPEVVSHFKVGQEVYIDLTVVSQPAATVA